VRSFTIQFTLPDSRLCVIDCVGTSSVVFAHSLKCAGQDIAELRTVLEPSMDEAMPRRAGIVDTRTFHDGQNKRITLYQLFVEPGTPQSRSLAIERRFSDFVSLDLLIRAATEPHLLSSLPVLPSKVYNPLVDQNSEIFINSRKDALQSFLQALLNNSKIAHYDDVFAFLGLDVVTGACTNAHRAQLSDCEESS
jgi:PX domain